MVRPPRLWIAGTEAGKDAADPLIAYSGSTSRVAEYATRRCLAWLICVR